MEAAERLSMTHTDSNNSNNEARSDNIFARMSVKSGRMKVGGPQRQAGGLVAGAPGLNAVLTTTDTVGGGSRKDGWSPAIGSSAPPPHSARESRTKELVTAGSISSRTSRLHSSSNSMAVPSAADEVMRHFFAMEAPGSATDGKQPPQNASMIGRPGDLKAETANITQVGKTGRVNQSPESPGSSPEMSKKAKESRGLRNRMSRLGANDGVPSYLSEGGSRLLADTSYSSSSSARPCTEQNSRLCSARGVSVLGPPLLGCERKTKAPSQPVDVGNSSQQTVGRGSAEAIENDSLQALLGPTLEGSLEVLREACEKTSQVEVAEAKPSVEGVLAAAAAQLTSAVSAESTSSKLRSRQKPKEISASLEFKPLSRSSSEANSAQVSPKQENKDKKNDKDRGTSITSSIHSNRQSLTTCYVNFDKFDLQIENGRAPTKIVTWDQLAAFVPQSGSNVLQAVEWYAWESPMKFQALAIPCIIQACLNVGDAKSYTLLQASSGLGKTSSLALGILASVRCDVNALQFIIVGVDALDEMESYINALARIFSVKAAYFKSPQPPNNLDDAVEEAQGAQIIVGHPSHVLAVLKASQEKLALQTMEVLLMDDALSLINEGLVQKVCEINQLCSLFAQRPLRYVVVSNFMPSEAKPALRALKSSLMSKKNMFDLSQQVGRIRKFVKHYVLRGSPEGWVQSLIKLRSMIYIPRAVIFCDDEPHFQELKKKFSSRLRGEDGKELTVAIMDSQSQSQSQRRDQLTSFCKEQQDFLLTRSEPNIFQSSLPRVFWIIHFGIESSNLSWYGCRLLCLDSKLRQRNGKGPQHEGVSILFLPPEKKEKDKTAVPKLEKMFGVKFEGLPIGDFE